jgi:hypothetical protein
MAMCAVVGQVDHNIGGAQEAVCITDGVVLLWTTLDANSHLVATAAIALALGEVGARRAEGSGGRGGGAGGAGAGGRGGDGAEPRSLDYLAKGSVLRVVFETLADASAAQTSRIAALSALNIAFDPDAPGLGAVLPPVDWTTALPRPPPRSSTPAGVTPASGHTTATTRPQELQDRSQLQPTVADVLVVESLRFALKHHAGSPSLQRYVSAFAHADTFPGLSVALRVELANNLPAITQLLGVGDFQSMLDHSMLPALVSKDPSEGAFATAVLVGVRGCLDRSAPTADAAHNAALSTFAAVRAAAPCLQTARLVDDVVDLLARLPSGLLIPVVESVLDSGSGGECLWLALSARGAFIVACLI